MADQIALTIITPVRPEAVEPLRVALTIMSRDMGHNPILPFGKLPNIHFARFVVLDPAIDFDGRPLPPRLVFLSDADGSLERHLREIVTVAGHGLDLVYAHCEGYPPASARTRESRLAYLRAHLVRPAANYVNTRGRTVEQVRREADLRDAIQEYLDRSRRDWSGVAPEAVRAAIQQFIGSQESLRWALRPPRSDLRVLARERLHLAAGVFMLILLAPLALLALPAFLALLRFHELRDHPLRIRPRPERIQELAALEDHSTQNQFSAIGFV